MTCNLTPVTAACCPACAQRHAACNIADGFLYGRYLLRPPQRQKLVDIAQRLLASPPRPARTPVRLVAHLDGQEFRQGRFHLAQRRAIETARALRQLLERLQPNSSGRFRLVLAVARRFRPVGRRAEQNRRVEVCLPPAPARPSAGPATLVRFGLAIVPLRAALTGELESDVAQRRKQYQLLVQKCLAQVGSGVLHGSTASELAPGALAWQVALEVPDLQTENPNLRAGDYFRDRVGQQLRQCLGNNWKVEIEDNSGRTHVPGLPGRIRKHDIVLTQLKPGQGAKPAQFYVETKLGSSRLTKYQKKTDDYNQQHRGIPTLVVRSSKRQNAKTVNKKYKTK
jgi:hypothetical protein